MIILSLLLGLFFATTVILGYIVYICQNKIDIYEGWIVEFKNDVSEVYQQIKLIDDKQLFEKDDEVGSIFSDLYLIIQKLNQRIEENVKNQNQNQENQEDKEDIT
jgi:hypothetical protein